MIQYSHRYRALYCSECFHAVPLGRTGHCPERISIRREAMEQSHRCRKAPEPQQRVRILHPSSLKERIGRKFDIAIKRATAEMERQFPGAHETSVHIVAGGHGPRPATRRAATP